MCQWNLFFPPDGSWGDGLRKQAACHRPRMGSELLRLLPPFHFPWGLEGLPPGEQDLGQGDQGGGVGKQEGEEDSIREAERLLNRWKTTNVQWTVLGLVVFHLWSSVHCSTGHGASGDSSFFCNNQRVFCGIEGGKVKVYTLTDGQWVRDLDSGTGELLFGRSICGSETYFGIIPSIKPIPHL